MARQPIPNVGNEDAEGDIETSFTPGEQEDQGGFAPGVREQVTHESNGDSEQDVADQEAAGVRTGSNKAPPTTKQQLRTLNTTIMKLGAQHGAGKTSMIALGETVVEYAAGGVIATDEVAGLYDKFRRAAKDTATYEDAGEIPDEAVMEKAPLDDADKSREQQISKLKRFAELGVHPFYRDDALALVQRARNIHIDLLGQKDRSTIKPGSTYTVMVQVCREQMGKHNDAVKAARAANQPTKGVTAPLLTNDELLGLMTQEPKENRVLEGADKILNAIKEAKAAYHGSTDRAPVPSPELEQAIEFLTKALAAESPDLLADYNKKLDDAEQAKIDAENKKAQAAHDKAQKALEPKPERKPRGPKKVDEQADAAA